MYPRKGLGLWELILNHFATITEVSYTFSMFTQHPCIIPSTWTIQKMKLTWFWVRITHTSKDLVSWGSLTKTMYIYSCEQFHNLKKKKKFIVTQVWYTKGLFQGLTQNNNMKLRRKKKEFENSFTTFYIFERNGWIIDSIHLHLLNIFLHQ